MISFYLGGYMRCFFLLFLGLFSVLFSQYSLGGEVAQKPPQEITKSIFPNRTSWPVTLNCVRVATKYYGDKMVELDHRNMYVFNFKQGVWSDSNNQGKLEYLGENGEFSVLYLLRDKGEFPYETITFINNGNNLMANRAEIVGEHVFAYWSQCSVPR